MVEKPMEDVAGLLLTTLGISAYYYGKQRLRTKQEEQ